MEFIIVLCIIAFTISIPSMLIFDFNPNLSLLPVKFKIKLKYYKNKLIGNTQVPFWYEDLVYERIKEMKDKNYNNFDIFFNFTNILRVYCNDKEIVLIDRDNSSNTYRFYYNSLNEMLLLSYIIYKKYNNADTKNNGIDDFIKSVEIRKKIQSGDIENLF